MSARRRVTWILVWLAVLSPFAIYFWHVPRFGRLPRNDYWGDFRQLLDGDRLTNSPLRWLQARSNEHRIALPLAAWTVNIRLTGGDNRVLSLGSLALLGLTFACLWRLLPPAVRGSPATTLGFGLPLAALLATPVAAHCWVLGFSGNQWYSANLSAAAGIACFSRSRAASGRWLLAAALVTLPGVFSHSTHLALWPALTVGALLVSAPRWTRAACTAAALAWLGFFLWGYGVPSGHPALGSGSSAMLGFGLAYLGLKTSLSAVTSQAWGAAGLLLFVLALGLTLARPRGERWVVMPPLLLALYALGNAAGTALARAGMGLETALASRYAPVAALFWIGTLGVLGLAACEIAAPRRRAAALGFVSMTAAVLLLTTGRSGCELLRSHLERVERQPLAALALVWDVDDDDALRAVAYRPAQTRSSRAFFRRVGQVPFDRAVAWPLGERWEGPSPEAGDAAGEWRAARHLSSEFVAVAGTARAPRGVPRRVVFLDTSGVLRGGGVFVPRDGAPPPPLFVRSAPGAFWRGYVERCAGSLQPYLEIVDGGRADLVPLRIAGGIADRLDALCGAGRTQLPAATRSPHTRSRRFSGAALMRIER